MPKPQIRKSFQELLLHPRDKRLALNNDQSSD